MNIANCLILENETILMNKLLLSLKWELQDSFIVIVEL